MISRTKKLIVAGGITVLASVMTIAVASGNIRSLLTQADVQKYSLTLNNSNSVSSAGTYTQHTARGSNVQFTYTDVASYAGGHTKINQNGTIINKDQITSISSFVATYSGTGILKARIAYVTDKWNDYFEVTSGTEIETGSNPYFLELKAFNGYVYLSSATYKFTCTANPAAETQETSETYDITFATHASDGATDLSTDDSVADEVKSGSEYISGFGYCTKLFAGAKGLRLGSGSYTGHLTIEFNSTTVVQTITSIEIATAKYGSDSGSLHVYVNGSSSYETITPSAGGTVSVNAALTSLELETTTKRAYLCGLTLSYGGTTEPGEPDNPEAYVTGFAASDSKKDEYTTNSIFDNENGLSVVKNLSDGTSQTLTSAEFSYVVKDAYDQPINTAQKFPAVGVYTLVVSYGNYIPQEITLNVGEYVYMTDVAASMGTVTFNTADTLQSNLAGNLTATIEYSNNTSSNTINYGDFAANGLAVKLLNPKGITYDMSKPFGTAGSWTLKVYDINNEEMYYNIPLTVNAIPVQTISLNETSYSLYPEDTLQLVATVNPTNATNDQVIWSTNNGDVATVDENGLVTAVAVGGATITATAADGSNVYGSCAITVVAKPASPTYTLVTDNSSLSNGDKVVVSTSRTDSDLKGVTGWSGNKDATVSETEGDWVEFVVGNASKDGWTLYDSSAEKYIASPSGSNQFLYGTTGATCSADSSGHLIVDSRYLCQNSTYYRFYTSIGSYTPFFVYQISSGAPTIPVYPTSISLTGTNSIFIGGTTQLSVAYSPEGTNVKNVTFSSNNTSIATVSSSGLVTGVAQGSATITATAEAENGTVDSTLTVTINSIAVTSVSLDTNSTSVKVGKTVTLVATINPSNATNKNVTWTSNATSVATVNSSGVVTGVSAGSATITVKTADGNKTATCVVTVVASGGEESFDISYTDLPTAYQTGSTIYTADSGIKYQAYNCANYSGKMQFRASSGYLQNTEDLELQSITINDRESNTLTVYGSNTAGSFSTTITGTNDVYDLSGYSYFKVARTSSGAAYCSSITVLTGTPTPTNPTSIIMSSTSAEVGIGGTKQLSVSYVPSNANQNKDVTWTSSNTKVATVSSDGLASVKSTATAGQTATITATLTNITSIKATCTITVTAQSKDNHTVLLYICGADLESKNSLATGDIQEILKVNGQPDDVNIVIETGGANSWASAYGISSTKLERWHVDNRSLVKDASLTYASMGLTSTLQSFIEYGLNNYPAERTGLILWNHGGGMHGVCYDEKKSDDSLLDNEVKSAASGALSNCGMSGQKLEWIGYDACLMAVQDIADFNSSFFNYMIASEESEAGYGWDYDNWVDDLYAKKTTPVILKAICDSFISDNGGVNSSSGDQTLSYLDLSKAEAYRIAWEALASQLQGKLTSTNKSTFNNAIINNVKHFADSDYDYFCLFDAKDFVNKLASNSAFSSFKVDASYTNAVLTAHSNLVAYSTAQKGAGNAYGLCMYWCNNSRYSDMSVYTTSHTNFTTWRSVNYTYGTHR